MPPSLERSLAEQMLAVSLERVKAQLPSDDLAG